MDNSTRPTCASENDCDRVAFRRGLCKRHYKDGLTSGDLPRQRSAKTSPECGVEGCMKPVTVRGMCAMHYKRWRVHGDARSVYGAIDGIRVCRSCEQTFVHETASPSPHCRDCRNAARRAKRADEYMRQPNTCVECAVIIRARHGKQLYCSTTCATKAERRRLGYLVGDEIVVCAVDACATPFRPSRKAQKYCSSKCVQRSRYLRDIADPDRLARRYEYMRSYHIRNRDRLLAYSERWRSQNRDLHREMSRSWYIANRTQQLERIRSWARAHPDRRAEKERRRRAAKARTTVQQITSRMLQDKSAYWGSKCWMCGSIADTWDHVKPLAAGGPHILANLRPACRRCNSSKNAKWPYSLTA